MSLSERKNRITRFLQVSLDLANAADEGVEDHPYWEECNMGCRALSGYLRQGVKCVIDLQSDYYRQKENEKYARMSNDSARDFLKDIFGDRDIDSLNDELKTKLKNYVQHLYDEWDEEDE